MSHYRNRRAFAARTARGFMRLNKFSSADKPAPSDLAFAGTTGPAEGSDSKVESDTGSPDADRSEGTAQRDVGLAAPPCGVTTATASSYVTTEVTGATPAAPSIAGQPGVEQQQQRGSSVTSKPQRHSPPSSIHSAGGGVCCVMLAQVHADRWATLAVIAVFFSVFAVAIIRANRFPKPLRRGGRDAEKPNEPQGMALAHDSEASRINRGLTPDGHRTVKQPAGRVMPQQQFSSRPTTPPRWPFAGRRHPRTDD